MNNQSFYEEFLHTRIIKKCIPLFQDGYYPQSAHEALKQVELALKEKSGEKRLFGVNLCKHLFGKEVGIKLRNPFGDDLQEKAEVYFSGVFGYYRNYATHDGTKIDRICCMRILIIASDLLDLIGASQISFADIGGIDGLIKKGIFQSKEDVVNLLKLLDSYIIVGETFDGFFGELAIEGFSDEQYVSVCDIGLVEYIQEPYIPSQNEIQGDWIPPDVIGQFTLTHLGKSLLEL